MLALKEEDEIEITPTLKLPGLLSACRQTRSESRALYHQTNMFSYVPRGLDISVLLAWADRARKGMTGEGASGVVICFPTRARRNWRNMKVWLDDIFVWGPKSFLLDRPLGPTYDSTFASSVKKVQALVLALHGHPRRVYEAQLSHMRELLGLFDPEWLQDL